MNLAAYMLLFIWLMLVVGVVLTPEEDK